MRKKGLTALLFAAVVTAAASCQTKGGKAASTETESAKVTEEVPVQKVDIDKTDSQGRLKDGQHWTDGFASYVVEKRGDCFFFFGGTTHEGGYTFGLQPQNDGSYQVKESNWSMIEDKEATEPKEEGYVSLNGAGQLLNARHCRLAGEELLVVSNEGGQATDVLVLYDGELSNRIVYEKRLILAGKYQQLDGNGELKFTNDGKVLMPGETKPVPFAFEPDGNDLYCDVFKVNGRYYGFMMTEDGLELYETNKNADEGNYEQGRLVGKYKKTASADNPNSSWPYGFTSHTVLTTGMLESFSVSMLRLIRNEIWARHGYVFADAELAKRFSSRRDYKPTDDNNAIELSPLEQVNVSLLRSEELRRNKFE